MLFILYSKSRVLVSTVASVTYSRPSLDSRVTMMEFQRYLVIALIFCYDLIAISEGAKVTRELKDYPVLKLVNVVFRHGDRTPDQQLAETYPNDPYKNYNFYPNENAQLTNIGKMRAYKLGEMLRTRYNKFLGDVYYQPNVYARSSLLPRTKMTLQLVLAALYPPIGSQIWNPKLLWQPMNIEHGSDQDNLLFPFTCPTFMKDVSDVINSPAWKERTKKYSALMKTVSKYAGHDITHIRQLFFLYHTLYAESSMGLKLPAWTNDLFPHKFTDVVNMYFETFNYNDNFIRRNGGTLLRRIIDDMGSVINGTSTNLKLNLFSGHDVNVLSLLYALKLYNKQIPLYTSSVILELHAKDDKYFVKILYYFGIPPDIKELTLPNCEVLCPYDKFVQLTSALTGKREQHACE